MSEPLTPTEVFAGNASINSMIHAILARFPEPSRSRMRTKIRHDRDALGRLGTDQADENARHTFREFIVGDELNRRGICLEYGRKIGGMTPDWSAIEMRLLLEVFTIERGGTTSPAKRAMDGIARKVHKYARICETEGLVIVIAIHADFMSLFSEGDCERAIVESNVFATRPLLGGVLYFGETVAVGGIQSYRLLYFPNRHSRQCPELPLLSRDVG
jgi:hypothetical protein